MPETKPSSYSQKPVSLLGLLGILFSGVVVWSLSRMSDPKHESSSTQHPQDNTEPAEQLRKECSSPTHVLIDAVPPPTVERETREKKAEGRDQKRLVWERRTAVFLAVYTVITFFMWLANKQSADAAATQLKLSERSWVGMAKFNIGEDHPGQDVPFRRTIAPNVPIAGNFYLQNYGKTPARIDGIGIQLEVRSTPVPNDFTYKNGDNKGPIMFPDTTFQTANTNDVTISEADFRELSIPGGKRLVIHGMVRYHDNFGPHWTKFCLTWVGESTFFANCVEHNDADE